MNRDVIKLKPQYLYFKNEGNLFQCIICGHQYTSQTNAIRHVHVHDGDENGVPYIQLSSFKYKGNNILKATENILLWKASHGISMAALADPLLQDLLPQNVSSVPKRTKKS